MAVVAGKHLGWMPLSYLVEGECSCTQLRQVPADKRSRTGEQPFTDLESKLCSFLPPSLHDACDTIHILIILYVALIANSWNFLE